MNDQEAVRLKKKLREFDGQDENVFAIAILKQALGGYGNISFCYQELRKRHTTCVLSCISCIKRRRYGHDITHGGQYIMKRRSNVLIALLCSTLVAGIPFGSMAADKIPTPPSIKGITSGTGSPAPSVPATPPGNDGLLSGMNPGNYALPSGWSLVRTQDFEGTQPASESWDGNEGASTTRSHSGSKSLEGDYPWDSADVKWQLKEGNTGSFSEIYLSFYEYTESKARFNDEYCVARFLAPGAIVQDIVVDWMWAGPEQPGPNFNEQISTLFIVPQGSRTKRLAGQMATVPVGQWVQWEIHYRPSTIGLENNDGFFRVYKNGSLFVSAENVNINGEASMANTMVQAGGFYTKIVWMTDYPTCSIPSGCSPRPGVGNDLCVAKMGWWGQSFSSPKCAPKDPPLPSFKRFIDDVIVMKKTAG